MSDMREGSEWRKHVGKVSFQSGVQSSLSILVSVGLSCSMLQVKRCPLSLSIDGVWVLAEDSGGEVHRGRSGVLGEGGGDLFKVVAEYVPAGTA